MFLSHFHVFSFPERKNLETNILNVCVMSNMWELKECGIQCEFIDYLQCSMLCDLLKLSDFL